MIDPDVDPNWRTFVATRNPEWLHWSYRAHMRQVARMPDTGEMWEYNRARPLDPEEYDHWETHVLPRGWSILRAPAERLSGPDIRER